ncbi:nickel ABC transporter permease [Tissierellaceae bacterium HCP3S3_D8]
MHKYVIRRLLLLMPVILGVTFLVFTIMYFTPGDAASTMLGESATDEQVEALREEMGLKDPFIVQYVRFLVNGLKMDFGRSYSTKRPVIDEIFATFPNTLKLTVASMTIAVVLGIPAGIISATKQYSLIDSITMIAALIGVSMPVFWLGLMLIMVFSLKLGLLPPDGAETFKHLILPAFSLGVGSTAIIARMTRSSMLEVIRQDYIRTARSKGVSERKVINRHALKNALIPIVTVVGLQFGNLLGGAVLTESVFSWPGIGRLMVDAIKQKDTPMVLASVIFISVTFSFVNLIVDLIYAAIDPRIKSQYR